MQFAKSKRIDQTRSLRNKEIKGKKQTSKGELNRFSTASTTPSFVFTPIALKPRLIRDNSTKISATASACNS